MDFWKNQQLPTVFLQDAKDHKYWTVVRHYTHYRRNTNNKLTFFQKVLVFSDGKQSFKPWPIVLSASTQTVLMCTVGTTEYKGHLNLKCSTTKRHIKTTLQRSTDIDIVAKNDIESHYISLALNAYARCASPRFLRLGEGQADPPGQLLPLIEDPSASHEAIEAWDLIFT